MNDTERPEPAADAEIREAYDKGLTDGYVAGLDSARRHIALMKSPLDRYTIWREIAQEIRSYKHDVEAGLEPKPAEVVDVTGLAEEGAER